MDSEQSLSPGHHSFTLQDGIRIVDRILLIFSLVLLVFILWDFFIDKTFVLITQILYVTLWLTFMLEFILRVLAADNKWQYIRGNLFVLFIILFPFLRPFRLFPLSRFGLLVIAEQVNERFPGFRRFRILEILLVSVVLVILSADLFLLFEKTPDSLFKTFNDALWFSVVTVATVGYGDVYPKTPQGRVLAVILIVFGVSIFGIVTASISSYLVEQDIKDERKIEENKIQELVEEEKAIESKLDQMYEKESFIESKLAEISKRFDQS
ncbi:MAG: ion channel [bacterium]|nr:ion channel [bacterium]